MKTEEHYYCTWVGDGFSVIFTVIGCSGTCGEALLLGVEKKFQVRMSRAGRSQFLTWLFSVCFGPFLEIKMLSFGYLITVEPLLRFPMAKDSSFSLPYFLFLKKIIIYVSNFFSCLHHYHRQLLKYRQIERKQNSSLVPPFKNDHCEHPVIQLFRLSVH